MKRFRIFNNNSGAILLSSLWILIILTLMAAGISFRARLMINLTENYLNTTRNSQLALSGYYKALEYLQDNESKNYNALNENWANNKAAFYGARLGENGKYSIYYQTPDGTIIYGIFDEERKININTVPEDILLNIPGFTEELVESFLDWIDTDNNERVEGAENEYYEDNDFPYKCKNGPIDFLEELKMIRGFNDEIISSIKPVVTVFGNGAVNINTADRKVLSILGIDDPLIELIIEFRNGDDRISGTSDDGVFKNEKEIPKTLSEYELINPDEHALLMNLISKNLLCVKSSVFTINSHGYMKNKDESTMISATVYTTGIEGSVIRLWRVWRGN